MNNERQLIQKTKDMIDGLKAVCSTYGLGNASSEYKIITEIFLYKYLNDKFIYEVKQVEKKFNEETPTTDVEEYLYDLEPNDFSILTMRMSPNVAKIKKEYMISYLYNNQDSTFPEFYQLFDKALSGIANDNIDIFSVKTGSKEKIKLFDNLSQFITEENKRNNFFRAVINRLVNFSFEDAFKEKYDFFATIFEYLIKDYNKDFGKYAEYYTPNSIARIIAKILAPNPIQNVTLYDPAGGSGTLVLALAHQIGEDNCTLYTQDISQKSNEFLRLNLILNNLVHSLGNIIHGDTLLNPAHLNQDKTQLAKFDYIVSNPPFRTDFSDTRDQLDTEKFRDRFFAGVPKIPKKDLNSMPIYLMFIQHIIYTLKEEGKAAIVVPTGFLTSKNGIEKKLLDYIVKHRIIKGIIKMPPNLFATTGTNVSVLLIEKNKLNNEVMLIDASNMGIKIRDGKNQRTILEPNDVDKIINVYCESKIEEDYSIKVDYDTIINNNCSLNPGQYFGYKIEIQDITKEGFNNAIKQKVTNISKLFEESQDLSNKIIKNIEDLYHDF